MAYALAQATDVEDGILWYGRKRTRFVSIRHGEADTKLWPGLTTPATWHATCYEAMRAAAALAFAMASELTGRSDLVAATTALPATCATCAT